MAKFKDSMNRWVTSGLFKELATRNPEFICMTLEEGRERFIACGDPTGIAFADKHLGGYQHWKALKNCKALERYIGEWEEELEVRLMADSLQSIIKSSENDHYQASKFLIDRGWKKRRAGKPTKDEVERETRVQAKLKESWNADVKRIKRD
jgi:hypothetical protein